MNDPPEPDADVDENVTCGEEWEEADDLFSP